MASADKNRKKKTKQVHSACPLQGHGWTTQQHNLQELPLFVVPYCDAVVAS